MLVVSGTYKVEKDPPTQSCKRKKGNEEVMLVRRDIRQPEAGDGIKIFYSHSHSVSPTKGQGEVEAYPS